MGSCVSEDNKKFDRRARRSSGNPKLQNTSSTPRRRSTAVTRTKQVPVRSDAPKLGSLIRNDLFKKHKDHNSDLIQYQLNRVKVGA